MKETAKRAALATLVVGGIVVAALALWKLKLVLALLFFAFIIAAAMRPGIDWLKEHGVPRGVGLLLHYLGLFRARRTVPVDCGAAGGQPGAVRARR